MPSIAKMPLPTVGRFGKVRYDVKYKCEAKKSCNELFDSPNKCREHEAEHRQEQ